MSETNVNAGAAGKESQFQLLRIIIPVAIAVMIAGVWFAFQVYEWEFRLIEPELIPAKVRVTYEDEPIPSGTLKLKPLDGQPGDNIGIYEGDGIFSLKTQRDGRLFDGAYEGRFKVAVWHAHSYGFGNIDPLVPEKYFTLEETPLTITVSEETKEKPIELILTGELNEKAKAYLQRLAEQENEIAEILSHDQDGDGKVSPEEAPENVKERFDDFDGNGDGFLDSGELKRLVEQPSDGGGFGTGPPGGRSGRGGPSGERAGQRGGGDDDGEPETAVETEDSEEADK